MNSLKVTAQFLARQILPWGLACLISGTAWAQAASSDGVSTPAASNTLPASSLPVASEVAPGAAPAPTPAITPTAAQRDTRPTWAQLTRSQQHALKPLASSWPSISEAQKRKWLALSHNFGELSAQEQGKLHERMSDWAHLSARERAQARLHFAEVSQLPQDERLAKWEAYQALSQEERQKLADTHLLAPRGAAVATRPLSPGKLTMLPAPKADQVLQPRIDTDQINPKTLLPHFLQGTSTP